MWEMQKSSTDESIPEDARSVLEHPNLKRGPVGAMGPALCDLFMAGRSFQPFAISPFEKVVGIYQENLPVNLD